jgi:hypothetical protein
MAEEARIAPYGQSYAIGGGCKIVQKKGVAPEV